MARIRTVKPILFFDEELADLSIPARYLFIGLFTMADRAGRLEDRPKNIKANIYPYDKINVEGLLGELSAKFIIRYTVDGDKFIQIVNFEKHQRITGKESSTESLFPKPPGKHRGNNRETPGKQTGSNRDEQNSQEGKGMDIGKGMDNGNGYDPKTLFLEFVLLTASEHRKLVERFGTDETARMIKKLDNYIGSKGVKYKSHYRTILAWKDRDEEAAGNKDKFGKLIAGIAKTSAPVKEIL